MAQELFEGGGIERRDFKKVPGVKDLTEELLFVASDALQVVVAAAPSPAPSGKAQQRLFCRLVAAAMGSKVCFDDNREAAVIGKRLMAQVARVRAVHAKARVVAADARADAQAAAAGDAGLMAALPAALAAFAATEQEALAGFRHEVYTGFVELLLAAPAVGLANPVPVEDAPRAARAQLPGWLHDYLRRSGGEQLCSELATAWQHANGSHKYPLSPTWSEVGTDSEMMLAYMIAEMHGRRQHERREMVATRTRLDRAERDRLALDARCSELEADAAQQERERELGCQGQLMHCKRHCRGVMGVDVCTKVSYNQCLTLHIPTRGGVYLNCGPLSPQTL